MRVPSLNVLTGYVSVVTGLLFCVMLSGIEPPLPSVLCPLAFVPQHLYATNAVCCSLFGDLLPTSYSGNPAKFHCDEYY